MAFRIGQKVVCVNDTWRDTLIDCPGGVPVKGGVYTVRGFCEHYPEITSIYLEEIVNPPFKYLVGAYEPSFLAWRFRPVVERKTNISVFKEILNRTPTKQPAQLEH